MRRACLLLLPAVLAAATAESHGRRIHYESRGTGARTLVLIHGWTCDGGFWSANLPALSQHNRVLVVDLPGHGRSEPCATCSMEEFGDAVLAVMDAAGARRAILVGHSMGGAVMLAALRRAPQRIQAIVAVDAVFSMRPRRRGSRARATGSPDLRACGRGRPW